MWWLTFSSNKCWTVSCSESGVQLSGVRTKQLKTLLGQVLTVSSLDNVQSRLLWMWHLENECTFMFKGFLNMLIWPRHFPLREQMQQKAVISLCGWWWPVDREVTGHPTSETLRRLGRVRGDCYNQLSGHGLAASFNTKLPRNRIWESSQNK